MFYKMFQAVYRKLDHRLTVNLISTSRKRGDDAEEISQPRRLAVIEARCRIVEHCRKHVKTPEKEARDR